jgi:hypothetical protein
MEEPLGPHTHTTVRINIHINNATGLFGGVRGYWTFGFERAPDVGDVRLVRDCERERGFKTGLLRERKGVIE